MSDPKDPQPPLPASADETTSPLLMIPPAPSREDLLHEGIKAVLEANQQIAAYRRDLFDPGGAMDRFTNQVGRLETALKEHDARENANHLMMREAVRGLRADLDTVSRRTTSLEQAIDDHHDRLAALESRHGTATEPAPPLEAR